MSAVQTIQRVLDSGVLPKSLIYVPDRGVTNEELQRLSTKLPRHLSSSHLALLKRWNGINLDVVRLYGASPTEGELRGLIDVQRLPPTVLPGLIIFGDNPAGFVYAEAGSGEILSIDSSTEEIKIIAANIDDFIGRLVFGVDSNIFAGQEWFDELRAANLI